MKMLMRLCSLFVVLLACVMAGDIGAFIDIPSMLFVFPGTFFTLYAKFGKDLLTKDNELKKQIGSDGINISFIWGFLGALVGFITILGNLTDMAALGPALAVSLLTIFYAILISLIVFYPMTQGPHLPNKELGGVTQTSTNDAANMFKKSLASFGFLFVVSAAFFAWTGYYLSA